jgi:hypothetical protein
MVAVFFAYSICRYWDLPEGYWALYAVITCTNPTQGLSVQRSIHRLLGTALGMFVGIAIVLLLPKNVIALDVVLIIFMGLAVYNKVFGYGYYILGVTIVTILMMCLLFPSDWHSAITRFAMTLLGVVIATAASLLLWPVRNSDALPKKILAASSFVERYLTTVFIDNSSVTRNDFVESNTLPLAHAAMQLAQFEYGCSARVLYRESVEILTDIYQVTQSLSLYPLSAQLPLEIEQLVRSISLLVKSIPRLFSCYSQSLFTELNAEFASLYQQLHSLRSKAAANPKIESTTLSDHINLMLQLQAIMQLLGLIEKWNRVGFKE